MSDVTTAIDLSSPSSGVEDGCGISFWDTITMSKEVVTGSSVAIMEDVFGSSHKAQDIETSTVTSSVAGTKVRQMSTSSSGTSNQEYELSMGTVVARETSANVLNPTSASTSCLRSTCTKEQSEGGQAKNRR